MLVRKTPEISFDRKLDASPNMVQLCKSGQHWWFEVSRAKEGGPAYSTGSAFALSAGKLKYTPMCFVDELDDTEG